VARNLRFQRILNRLPPEFFASPAGLTFRDLAKIHVKNAIGRKQAVRDAVIDFIGDGK
jgi:hypothetical protein